jgi:LmbE family N-acetylglucosaminyl deacetylase
MVTSGEAGIDALEPEQCRPVREAEQIASAALVGVDDVSFLGHPDGMLEYGLPLRRDIARAVRKYRPDIVITTNFRETYGGVFPNQADHIAVGRATLDAVRDAGNRWVFRELLDEGLAPHKVGMALVGGVPDGSHGVDVSDSFAVGLASLEAHAEYLRGLGDGPMADPQEFLESFARQAGTRMGCRYAVSFEVIAL